MFSSTTHLHILTKSQSGGHRVNVLLDTGVSGGSDTRKDCLGEPWSATEDEAHTHQVKTSTVSRVTSSRPTRTNSSSLILAESQPT